MSDNAPQATDETGGGEWPPFDPRDAIIRSDGHRLSDPPLPFREWLRRWAAALVPFWPQRRNRT